MTPLNSGRAIGTGARRLTVDRDTGRQTGRREHGRVGVGNIGRNCVDLRRFVSEGLEVVVVWVEFVKGSRANPTSHQSERQETSLAGHLSHQSYVSFSEEVLYFPTDEMTA